MSLPSPTETEKHADAPSAKCLARSVTEVLSQEPALEAVTFNRLRKTISVATLGQVDVPKLTERVASTIQNAQAGDAISCGLLSGEGDCQSCALPLTEKERGVITIRNEGNATTLARVTCPTAPHFWRWRDIPWPKVVQRDVEFLEHADHIDEWKGQLVAAVLCGVFGLSAFILKGHPAALYCYLLAYLAGGWFTVQEVWERLQQRAIDVHFLMLAVAAGSASIGAWGEGSTLLFLFSFSGALEHYALGRTQREIRSLFREAPKVATVLDAEGHESEVAVERLRPGMRLLIKPGAQFPVDAEVAKGQTASDESNLTGEATPVEKAVGDSVLAGTLNLWGAVEVIVTKAATESALQKIIQLIKEAQQQKAPAQQFTDKFSTYYTYIILGLSLVMFFVWWLGRGLSPFTAGATGQQSAFYHTMTLLVVASPCALVLSIPSAVLAAIAWGARHGILFRGGAAVEKLAGINTVALDKTGTLTTGELRVERVESFPAGREAEVARLAFSLERLSTHPLARAVTRYGRQRGLDAIEFDHFESVTGQGLQTRRGDKICRLGRREWLAQNMPQLQLPCTSAPPSSFSPPLGETGGASVPASLPSMGERAGVKGLPNSMLDVRCSLPVRKHFDVSPPSSQSAIRNPQSAIEEAGLCEVWLTEGDLLGRVVLRDDIRPQARSVVEELRRAGLRTVVLTGDRKATADYLKAQLGLDDVRAELKPEQKVAEIRALGAGGQRVAMVGDGVNDAPSLAAADVGVAMGARGSDAALEQAEVVLMHDRLENFLAAFRLSQRARRVIRQNLVISLGTVVVLVCFAMLGRIPLTIGVVGHEGSTVIVVMNSLRLLIGAGSRKSSVAQ
ncbi:MAG: heavy metal translocating P-type ATPase [Pedosphaera sp.]|nr:heavy metal translocating P-type ATPase [Pedosphaera sp.]